MSMIKIKDKRNLHSVLNLNRFADYKSEKDKDNGELLKLLLSVYQQGLDTGAKATEKFIKENKTFYLIEVKNK